MKKIIYFVFFLLIITSFTPGNFFSFPQAIAKNSQNSVQNFANQEVYADCYLAQTKVNGKPDKFYHLIFYVDGILINQYDKVMTGDTRQVSWSDYPQIDMSIPHVFKSVLIGVDTQAVSFGGYHCTSAVFIINFNAFLGENVVKLVWETTTEVFNIGFNLYQSKISNDKYMRKINEQMIPVSTYPGAPFGAVYEYTDTNSANYYWLEVIDLWGTSTFYGPVNPL